MLPHHNIDRDRKVKVLKDGVAISSSNAQSEYAKFLNFSGNDFNVVENTGLKTYDISLKPVVVVEDPITMTGSLVWAAQPQNSNTGNGVFQNLHTDIRGAASTIIPNKDVDGMHLSFTTDINNTNQDCSGYTTGTSFVYPEWSPRLRGKVKLDTITGLRCFIGFSSNLLIRGSDAFLNGIDGFGMRFAPTASTNWVLEHCNAATAISSRATGTIPTPAVVGQVMTFDIKYDYNGGSPRIVWSINGVTHSNRTATIPTLGTPLRWTIRIETTDAVASTMRSYYQVFNSDK